MRNASSSEKAACRAEVGSVTVLRPARGSLGLRKINQRSLAVLRWIALRPPIAPTPCPALPSPRDSQHRPSPPKSVRPVQ